MTNNAPYWKVLLTLRSAAIVPADVRQVVLVLLATLGLSPGALAAAPDVRSDSNEAAPGATQTVTPGGMVAGHYSFPGGPLSNMDYFFTIESYPAVSQSVFWAHQFWLLNGDGGYTGLQGNGIVNGQPSGKIAIFSIWQALGAEAGPGATAGPFGNEGTGYQVVMPFAWQVGRTYRFRIFSDQAGWWRVHIFDTVTLAETYLGRIHVPAARGALQPATANFTEIYNTINNCASVPYMRARFDQPKANSGSVLATLNDYLRYGSCGSFARGSVSGTSFFADIGTHGRDSVGSYAGDTGAWFLRNSNAPGPADIVLTYGSGAPGVVPLRGDWNGDGVDTPGLYDPSTGAFFLRNSNTPGPADIVLTFGVGGGLYAPLVGDWNSDAIDTIGLYSSATGAFFLKNSNSAGPADHLFTFGQAGLSYVAIAGDWNGDGKDSIGLYDPVLSSSF